MQSLMTVAVTSADTALSWPPRDPEQTTTPDIKRDECNCNIHSAGRQRFREQIRRVVSKSVVRHEVATSDKETVTQQRLLNAVFTG